MKLTARTRTLLFSANSATMEERYYEIEEQLYINEASDIFAFCQWIDKEIGGCSNHNISMLAKAYKGNKEAFLKAKDLAKKIKEIKLY